ncbi:phage integrase SAM-like domain-containing protein [Chitinophaga oryzae]|uniref:Phage integrase SAM-like domain-containing protein n=1 Tax=Chitinophaga oryzae TaxID=2725414 RepID=A0ABX6LFA6_9BACT|nr:site-specific integrase [Chitinophaga oryzae]QJB38776.1 phage integrase SAM-like domain-containing protein [Chitinophaga oryzae]
MLLPIKLICPKGKVRKDSTCIVFIQYCGAKTVLLNTEIAIPPKYWNRKFHRITPDLPAAYGTADALNGQLAALLRKANDIITHAVKKKVPDIPTFVKKTFHPAFDTATLEEKAQQAAALDPKTNLDLIFQIEDYIKCKRDKVSAGMLNVYKNMKDHIAAFQEHRRAAITFDSFDFNLYESLVNYLTYDYVQRRRSEVIDGKKEQIKGLKTSTIGKTIKQLRIFLRDRMRRKIIAPIDLSDFKILDEDADAVYLSWPEIARIYQADLSEKPHLTKYRDLFVLGCLTGLRFSDFSSIQPEDVRKGSLYKKQEKSDHWVVVPLRDAAEEILLKRFNRQIPAVSNPEFNRHIKEAAQLAGICELIKFSHKKGNKDIVQVKPKHEWITSHTCRRSFCTNEFLAGTPVELIMKISGHKSLRDFYRYIRITPEEAGRKIREIWEKRGDIGITATTLVNVG